LIDGHRNSTVLSRIAFRLRLVGAREEVVGELDGVLRPGDLRRMQPAADVDEDLALRREAPGVRCP
jgi:hypothetical protein